jgi:hypothetical protein
MLPPRLLEVDVVVAPLNECTFKQAIVSWSFFAKKELQAAACLPSK